MTLPRRSGYFPSATALPSAPNNGTPVCTDASFDTSASSASPLVQVQQHTNHSPSSARASTSSGPSLLEVSTPTAYFPFLPASSKTAQNGAAMETDSLGQPDGEVGEDNEEAGEEEEGGDESEELQNGTVSRQGSLDLDSMMIDTQQISPPSMDWDENEMRSKQEELRNHAMFQIVMRVVRKIHANSPHHNILSAAIAQDDSPDGLMDFSLDEFLKAQEINLYPNSSDPLSPNGSENAPELREFYLKLRYILDRYGAELNKLNHICDEYSNRMIQILQEQGTTRIVTQAELHLRLKAIKRQFDRVRTQLRQNVCSAIVALQRQYGQERKKRRTLSKAATDILNDWFFAHLHDPYPSDEEKMILATRAGITLNQVNNWFGNKRIRHKRKCNEQQMARNANGNAGAGVVNGEGGSSPQPDSDSPGLTESNEAPGERMSRRRVSGRRRSAKMPAAK